MPIRMSCVPFSDPLMLLEADYKYNQAPGELRGHKSKVGAVALVLTFGAHRASKQRPPDRATPRYPRVSDQELRSLLYY